MVIDAAYGHATTLENCRSSRRSLPIHWPKLNITSCLLKYSGCCWKPSHMEENKRENSCGHSERWVRLPLLVWQVAHSRDMGYRCFFLVNKGLWRLRHWKFNTTTTTEIKIFTTWWHERLRRLLIYIYIYATNAKKRLTLLIHTMPNSIKFGLFFCCRRLSS